MTVRIKVLKAIKMSYHICSWFGKHKKQLIELNIPENNNQFYNFSVRGKEDVFRKTFINTERFLPIAEVAEAGALKANFQVM